MDQTTQEQTKTGEETRGPQPPQADPKTENLGAISLRFLAKVEKQFAAEVGEGVTLSPLKKKLVQHMFLKVDSWMRSAEAKRIKDGQTNKPAFIWENMNMAKLALDSLQRIDLELDALIKNHIHPVPYWNSKLMKYDLDLRIGYEGRLYCHMKYAIDPPLDVVIRLVHKADKFKPIFKDHNSQFDSYTFEPGEDAFNRGESVGGFAYIMFENPVKNKLIIITPADFGKSQECAQDQTFWKGHVDVMRTKTVIHRACDQIRLDPTKVNMEAWAAIEESRDDSMIAEFEEEVTQVANGEVLSLAASSESSVNASEVFEGQLVGEKVKVPVAPYVDEMKDDGPGY